MAAEMGMSGVGHCGWAWEWSHFCAAVIRVLQGDRHDVSAPCVSSWPRPALARHTHGDVALPCTGHSHIRA